MRILLWHVHGSWTTAFVQGTHDYVLPRLPGRGPDGRGRARTWDWPASVVEATPEQLRDIDVDLVVLQRPHELDLVAQWSGRRPGRDLPAVYLEHNTPGGDVPFTRHLMAGQGDIPIVHVTHFNRLFWDCGRAPTVVIEHGVVDPGYRYTGELARAAVVVNDPVRRGRAVGSDLAAGLAARSPVDLFGMGAQAFARGLDLEPDRLRAYDDLPQDELHRQLARRRVYVHTARWTSLGLSLLEAMHLGMPVVAVAATEAARAVAPGAGVLVSGADELFDATDQLLRDPDEAMKMGRRARAEALRRYSLERFLDDWDALLAAALGPRAGVPAHGGSPRYAPARHLTGPYAPPPASAPAAPATH